MPRIALVALVLASLLAAVIALATRHAFRGDERARETAARTRRIWLALLITIPYVGCVSVVDAGCAFELTFLLRWLVAGYYLILVAWPARERAVRWIAGAALVWMLVVLPQVRWNHTKSFYVDARRLSRGMTVAEVRSIMAPHLELGAFTPSPEERECLPETPDPADGLIFLHCPRGYTDSCEVRLDERGRVREIEIIKD